MKELKLKKLAFEHLDKRVELLNNPQISSYLNTNEQFEIDKTKTWFEKASCDESRYDVAFRLGEEIVGMAGIVQISQLDKRGEIYIYMDPTFQGKGLGQQGLTLLIRVAFEDLKLNKLMLFTFADNERANQFYRSLGFKQEALLRQHTYRNGVLEDRLIFALLKDDWK